MSPLATRAIRSISVRSVLSLTPQSRSAPFRPFSLKLIRPRLGSAFATATTQSRPQPQQAGPFPYPSITVESTTPASHVRLQAEKEIDELKAKENAIKKTSSTLPEINFDDRRVAVGWDANTWSRFHNIWLRDHCRCGMCFHHITKQRLVDTFDIPSVLQPSEANATEAGLEVIWHGLTPHKSIYPWSWLRQNSYDPPFREEFASPPTSTVEQHEKVLWGSRIQQDPPTALYEEIMTDEAAVHKWLQKIERFGFCFVTGVPVTLEDTERLALRIGRIRETQYGGFWDFTADLEHGDTAYTNIALKAHTDTTYFTDPCGLQMFHLLSHTQGTGGQTLLVDGFYVASLLSTLEPEVYSLLSNVPVPTHSAGTSAESPTTMSYLYHPKPKVGYPILNHHTTTNELIQVRYNNDDRSVMCHLEPGMVEQWYNALRVWNKALTSPDSEYWVQLVPGTAVVMDNQRVLHGRSAFTGERRMCGAYIGMDDFVSRLNVLNAKFSPSAASPNTGSGSVWNPAF